MPSALDDADHHPRPDRPQVNLLDSALQGDDTDAVEHRRGDASGAQRHRQESGEQGREGERETERDGAATGEEGEDGKERDQRGRQPEDRLRVGRQIERDAAHRRNREPEEETPLLELARERAGERLSPVRRIGERARKADGPRQSTRAPGS